MEALKAESERYKLRDPPRAAEITKVAVEAASFSSNPLVMALALWAKGNVMLYVGDFRASIEAYRVAEAAYSEQGDHLSVARLQTNRVFALTNLGLHQEALALAETARQKLMTGGHEQTIYNEGKWSRLSFSIYSRRRCCARPVNPKRPWTRLVRLPRL